MAYAITFDMDTNCLHDAYSGSYDNAYLDIAKVLNTHGFHRQQGSVYFGGENSNSVDCILAVQDLATQYDWFALCHRLCVECGWAVDLVTKYSRQNVTNTLHAKMKTPYTVYGMCGL